MKVVFEIPVVNDCDSISQHRKGAKKERVVAVQVAAALAAVVVAAIVVFSNNNNIPTVNYCWFVAYHCKYYCCNQSQKLSIFHIDLYLLSSSLIARLSHLQVKEKVAERAGILSTVALQGGVIGGALRQVQGVDQVSCPGIYNKI